jgi:hypothetical protein
MGVRVLMIRATVPASIAAVPTTGVGKGLGARLPSGARRRE